MNYTPSHHSLSLRYRQGSLLTNIIKTVAGGAVGEEEASAIETFFHDNTVPGTVRTTLQLAESARLRGAWREKVYQDMAQHLAATDNKVPSLPYWERMGNEPTLFG